MSLSDERIRDEVLSRLAEGRGPMCTTFEGMILARELQSLRASQAKVVEALRKAGESEMNGSLRLIKRASDED